MTILQMYVQPLEERHCTLPAPSEHVAQAWKALLSLHAREAEMWEGEKKSAEENVSVADDDDASFEFVARRQKQKNTHVFSVFDQIVHGCWRTKMRLGHWF